MHLTKIQGYQHILNCNSILCLKTSRICFRNHISTYYMYKLYIWFLKKTPQGNWKLWHFLPPLHHKIALHEMLIAFGKEHPKSVWRRKFVFSVLCGIMDETRHHRVNNTTGAQRWTTDNKRWKKQKLHCCFFLEWGALSDYKMPTVLTFETNNFKQKSDPSHPATGI